MVFNVPLMTLSFKLTHMDLTKLGQKLFWSSLGKVLQIFFILLQLCKVDVVWNNFDIHSQVLSANT
jgi:hypothetical protein